MRHAIHSLAKYLFLHNEALVLHLDEIEDQAVVSISPGKCRCDRGLSSASLLFIASCSP